MSKIINFFKEYDSGLSLLNKDLYYKILFVDSDNTDLIFTTVDNSENFLTLFSLSKGFAYSFNIKSFFYRHTLVDEIFFLAYVLPFYNKYRLLLNRLNSVLFCIEKLKFRIKKMKRGLIFIKGIRAGFKCVYLGVYGFLSTKSFFFTFSKFKFISKIKAFYRINMLAVLFSKEYNSSLFQRVCFCFRVKIRHFKFYFKRKTFYRKVRKSKVLNLKILFLTHKVYKTKKYKANTNKFRRNHETKCRTKTPVRKKRIKLLFLVKKSN